MNKRCIKLILVTITVVYTLSASSQNRLINREIYNFNVGDIIHTFYYSPLKGLKPQSTKRKFLSKEYSSGNDSVTFIVLDSIYTLKLADNWELKVKIDTVTYIALDSFPSKLLIPVI